MNKQHIREIGVAHINNMTRWVWVGSVEAMDIQRSKHGN